MSEIKDFETPAKRQKLGGYCYQAEELDLYPYVPMIHDFKQTVIFWDVYEDETSDAF